MKSERTDCQWNQDLQQHGFTLIELLVVVSIIALLVAILLPALSQAREQAKKAVCLANQHAIGQSLVAYATENRDCYPTTSGYDSNGNELLGENPRSTSLKSRGDWRRMGVLFGLGFLDEARHFYCPSQPQDTDLSIFNYECGWKGQGRDPAWTEVDPELYKWGSYLYRIYNRRTGGEGTEWHPYSAEVRAIRYNHGMKALTSDYFFPGSATDDIGTDTWPHKKPYGVNVAYSDGHGEWAPLAQRWYNLAGLLEDVGEGEDRDQFAFYMFRSFDQNSDMSELEREFDMWLTAYGL